MKTTTLTATGFARVLARGIKANFNPESQPVGKPGPSGCSNLSRLDVSLQRKRLDDLLEGLGVELHAFEQHAVSIPLRWVWQPTAVLV